MPTRRAVNYSQPQLQAPRTRLEHIIDTFGTLNLTDDPTTLNETDSPDTLNTVFDTINSVGTRKGYTKVLTTTLANPIGGLVAFYKSDQTKQLVYGSGTHLYRYDNAGGSTVLTGAPATFTANQAWDFDVYQDAVYAGNGTEPLISYNGASYAIVNAAISPQTLCVHKNRVFCVPKNSSTLYFSDAGSPSSFPVNNFIQINTNDGQNITAVREQGDSLMIYKSESIFILDGEPVGAGNTTTIGNLQLRKVDSDVGCTSFRSVQRVGSVQFFMHKSGIYVVQNATAVLISQSLNKLFASGMNPGFLNLCWGLYSPQEKKYLLGFPSPASTTCDKVIVYDMLVKGYTLWDNMNGSCAANYRFSGISDSVVLGDATKGIIYQLFNGTADIAGANGTATAATTTTLTDSTKSWTTNQFVDAKVSILSGTGQGQTAAISSNTSTAITFSTMGTAPVAGSVYTIGGINSYWATKNFDFTMPNMTKKYKYLDLFTDEANYSMNLAISIMFQPLNYTQQVSLSDGSVLWGQAGIHWGDPGVSWGSRASVFKQANVAGQGRFIQYKWGTQAANQPWRMFRYETTYKLKKARPDGNGR